MKKRNFELDFETAKCYYQSDNEALQSIALKVFPELGKKELPKTWEELIEIEGFYINSGSRLMPSSSSTIKDNQNVFATKEQAEASIALAQLSQLREVYRQGWVPNNSVKYTIVCSDNGIREFSFVTINNFLSFQDAETRDLFLKNFKDLIEKARPLMS